MHNEVQVLQLANVRCSRALGACDHFEAYTFTFGQRLETIGLDGGMMNENVLATVLLDKAKSL